MLSLRTLTIIHIILRMSTPFFAKNNIYEFCVSYLAPQEHMLKSLNGFGGSESPSKQISAFIEVVEKYYNYVINQLVFFTLLGTMDMYTVYVCG